MLETKGSLKLKKPELTDVPDITAIDSNWETIDEKVTTTIETINEVKNEVDKKVTNLTNKGAIPNMGWYRVAESIVGVGRCLGTFLIEVYVNGKHSATRISCGTAYNSSKTLVQEMHIPYLNTGISKVRLVYADNYVNNKVFLEVYNPLEERKEIITTLSENTSSWKLINAIPSVIPSGYLAKELVLSEGSHNHDSVYLKQGANPIRVSNDDYLGYDDTTNKFYRQSDGNTTKHYLYDTENKPTPLDIGALATSGNGTINGTLTVGSGGLFHSTTPLITKRLATSDSTTVYIGNRASQLCLEADSTPRVGNYAIYHEGNKPNQEDVGFPMYTFTKNLTVTTEWTNTTISRDALETGTYVIQLIPQNSSTTGMYQETFTGIMAWFDGDCNGVDVDEIVLHSAGHSRNRRNLYLRVRRTLRGEGGMVLEISASFDIEPCDYVFKFRKLL